MDTAISANPTADMTLPHFDLVIFDCDGVLINSEELASEICIEAVKEVGLNLTMHEYADRYAGNPVAEIWRMVERDAGRSLPEGFQGRVDEMVFRRFSTDLAVIEGVVELLEAARHPKCVASSTQLPRLRQNLGKVGLLDHFDPHIFSGSQVKRGKPAPDVFLYAASQMGADPAHCLVIEDSLTGVTAARRAGMNVIGFCGGGHASPGLEKRLRDAGAIDVVRSMHDIRGRLA
jgi:HAD superfamily hydrolase (TIGR01509 family)